MYICEDSFRHLLRCGQKGDFVVPDCSCPINVACQLPSDDDVEILIKAYDFYDRVSCIIVEGSEFMTKSQMFDAINMEFKNPIKGT